MSTCNLSLRRSERRQAGREPMMEALEPRQLLNGYTGWIGDRVWMDDNCNGIQDYGESGVPGVTVNLLACDSTTPLETMQTDADGLYLFHVNAGDYRVQFVLPSGFAFSPINAPGSDDANDSDANVMTGITVCTQLEAGEVDRTWDAGLCAETPGDISTGTIGFWRNKNGQNLILSLNGSTQSTALGDWLASNFPKLYWRLEGATNSQVATFYKNTFEGAFNNTPGYKLVNQIMAVALAVYVTDSDLAGNAAVKYGFEVTSAGFANATWNVGDNGEPFGVPDNSDQTIWFLLQQANDHVVGGLLWGGDHTLRSMANDVFTAINEFGDRD